MNKHTAIEELLVVMFSMRSDPRLYSEGKRSKLVVAMSNCETPIPIKDMSTGSEVSTLFRAITRQWLVKTQKLYVYCTYSKL
jgi:hypothetical protein